MDDYLVSYYKSKALKSLFEQLIVYIHKTLKP